jgi:hypothetical protein
MPPQLTEAWATAYLQVLIIIFVFALGIPALVFQLIVPEDVRHVIHHRLRIRIWYASTCLLAFASISFVWIFHPHAGLQPAPWQSYVASAAVTITPLLALVSGALVFLSYKRNRVVGRLEETVRLQFCRSGVWDEESLDDLIYLGSEGTAGREKELALSALGRLAKEAQSHEFYRGSDLDQVIKGLEATVGGGERRGNDHNFISAAHILQSIWTNIKDFDCLDYATTKVTLRNLAISAVRKMSEPTAFVYLEDAATLDSDIVLAIGATALECKSFLIATAALNKLEALAEQAERITFNEQNANLLGLLAAFHVSGGSTRQRAQALLSRSLSNFQPSFPTLLSQAIRYHYGNGNYKISDDLLNLQSESASAIL